MTQDLDVGTSVGRIAAETPASIAVFEGLGIDYCCGGGRSLREAAQERGLDPLEVAEAIGAAAGAAAGPSETERDWCRATMTELADHIESTHHSFVRESLDRLKETLPRVIAAHGAAHPELREVERVLRTFSDEMHDHMVREERVLFPWLRRLERKTEIQGGPPWSVRRPIDCMVHDHESAAAALRTMRTLTGGFEAPADACGSYRSVMDTLRALEHDTHLHVHKENNILFPAGVKAEDACAAGKAGCGQ